MSFRTGSSLAVALAIASSSTVYPSFNFTFGVNETPNTGTPQQNADIISFPLAFPDESFSLDGGLWTLQLLGFGPSAGAIITQFSSLEGCSSTAKLWAQVTQAQVPEPTTILLLGIGFIGLAVCCRKKLT